MSLITYQLTGYNVDHWINREVSRVTSAKINHVGFRINFGDDMQLETYLSTKPSDTLVKVPVLRKVLGDPIWISPKHDPAEQEYFNGWVGDIYDMCRDYKYGVVTYPYFYHYIGRHLNMDAPRSCTDLVWRCCRYAGLHLKERFYPNELIKEYYQCML